MTSSPNDQNAEEPAFDIENEACRAVLGAGDRDSKAGYHDQRESARFGFLTVMAFPDDFTLAVDEGKIIRYLLSITHPTGRHKARFFRHLGFSPDQVESLRLALMQHGRSESCSRIEQTEFGVKYVVEGALIAPGMRTAYLRTVLVRREK